LITSIDNVGFAVTKLTKEMVADTYTSFCRYESLLVEESVKNGDTKWEGKLLAELHELSEIELDADIDILKWLDKNSHFHDVLISRCPFKLLSEKRSEFLIYPMWYYGIAYDDMANIDVEIDNSEHKKLVKLALSKKHKEAADLIYHHNMKSLDNLLDMLSEKIDI
jgi:DNA-binding GntR family transcriptional regulator